MILYSIKIYSKILINNKIKFEILVFINRKIKKINIVFYKKILIKKYFKLLFNISINKLYFN